MEVAVVVVMVFVAAAVEEATRRLPGVLCRTASSALLDPRLRQVPLLAPPQPPIPLFQREVSVVVVVAVVVV